MIQRFEDMTAALRGRQQKTAVAVVEAQDDHTIDAMTQAAGENLIAPLLIGREKEIGELVKKHGLENASVIGTADMTESLRVAASLVREGRAGAVMKGKLETGDLMKGILDKDAGLVQGGRLSLVGIYQMASYHKIFAVSDIGLNTYPDLALKKDILLNAVKTLHAIGRERPKVAVISAIEKPNPKMPDTVDGDALKRMNRNGEIGGCVVEGPVSFDLAMFAEAARIKGYESEVAGDADLLVMPDIVSGNVLVKCLTGFSGAITAGMVVGAKVPIILTSRAAEASDKYWSMVLAAYTAEYFQGGEP